MDRAAAERALRELATYKDSSDPRRFTDALRAAEDLTSAVLEASGAKEIGG